MYIHICVYVCICVYTHLLLYIFMYVYTGVSKLDKSSLNLINLGLTCGDLFLALVCISPDSWRVVSSGDDGTLRIWDLGGTGTPQKQGHPLNCGGVSYGPYGTYVCVCVCVCACVCVLCVCVCVCVCRLCNSG